MVEYIEREALMKFPIRRDHYDQKNGNEHFINGIECVLEYAENLPSADVAPVLHGRWMDVKEKRLYGDHYFLCSRCKSRNGSMIPFNYCPNCGARMDLEVMDNGQK